MPAATTLPQHATPDAQSRWSALAGDLRATRDGALAEADRLARLRDQAERRLRDAGQRDHLKHATGRSAFDAAIDAALRVARAAERQLAELDAGRRRAGRGA